jgi:hypothetical protein
VNVAFVLALQLCQSSQAAPRFTVEAQAGVDGPAGTGPGIAGSVALGQRWSFGIASALVPPDDGPLPLAAFLRARLVSLRRLALHGFSGVSQERRLTGGTYPRPDGTAETFRAGWDSTLRANAGIGAGISLGPVVLQAETGLGYVLGTSRCQYSVQRSQTPPPRFGALSATAFGVSCSNPLLPEPYRHEPTRWVPFASGAVVLPLGTVAAQADEPGATPDQDRRWELVGLELSPVGLMVNRQGLEDQVPRSLTLRIATVLRRRYFVTPLSGIFGVADGVDPALAGVFAEGGAVMPTSLVRGTFRIGGGLGAGLVVLGKSCDVMCTNGAPVIATTSVHYLARLPALDVGLVARGLMGLPIQRNPATVAVLLGLDVSFVH